MIFAIVLLPSPALACSCLAPGAEPFSPAFANVPTNAVVRFLGSDNEVPAPHLIFEDGVLRTDVVDTVEHHGASVVLTQSTLAPFAPGAAVEVHRDTESGPIMAMQVTDEVDLSPPTWDGEVVVDSTKSGFVTLSSCGSFRSHSFDWIGLEDDIWHPSELLVIAVPHDTAHAEFVGNGDVATVGEGACSHDDPTLKGDFHRAYDIFVEDGSGNRIGPFEVDTRQCGCAGAPFPGSGLTGFAAAALLSLRRRRQP